MRTDVGFPKGALTHHLQKQAVAALPLVRHVRSSRVWTRLHFRQTASLVHAVGTGGIPPPRRLPVSTCHRQLDTDTGVEQIVPPLPEVRRVS